MLSCHQSYLRSLTVVKGAMREHASLSTRIFHRGKKKGCSQARRGLIFGKSQCLNFEQEGRLCLCLCMQFINMETKRENKRYVRGFILFRN